MADSELEDGQLSDDANATSLTLIPHHDVLTVVPTKSGVLISSEYDKLLEWNRSSEPTAPTELQRSKISLRTRSKSNPHLRTAPDCETRKTDFARQQSRNGMNHSSGTRSPRSRERRRSPSPTRERHRSPSTTRERRREISSPSDRRYSSSPIPRGRRRSRSYSSRRRRPDSPERLPRAKTPIVRSPTRLVSSSPPSLQSNTEISAVSFLPTVSTAQQLPAALETQLKQKQYELSDAVTSLLTNRTAISELPQTIRLSTPMPTFAGSAATYNLNASVVHLPSTLHLSMPMPSIATSVSASYMASHTHLTKKQKKAARKLEKTHAMPISVIPSTPAVRIPDHVSSEYPLAALSSAFPTSGIPFQQNMLQYPPPLSNFYQPGGQFMQYQQSMLGSYTHPPLPTFPPLSTFAATILPPVRPVMPAFMRMPLAILPHTASQPELFTSLVPQVAGNHATVAVAPFAFTRVPAAPLVTPIVTTFGVRPGVLGAVVPPVFQSIANAPEPSVMPQLPEQPRWIAEPSVVESLDSDTDMELSDFDEEFDRKPLTSDPHGSHLNISTSGFHGSAHVELPGIQVVNSRLDSPTDLEQYSPWDHDNCQSVKTSSNDVPAKPLVAFVPVSTSSSAYAARGGGGISDVQTTSYTSHRFASRNNGEGRKGYENDDGGSRGSNSSSEYRKQREPSIRSRARSPDRHSPLRRKKQNIAERSRSPRLSLRAHSHSPVVAIDVPQIPTPPLRSLASAREAAIAFHRQQREIKRRALELLHQSEALVSSSIETTKNTSIFLPSAASGNTSIPPSDTLTAQTALEIFRRYGRSRSPPAPLVANNSVIKGVVTTTAPPIPSLVVHVPGKPNTSGVRLASAVPSVHTVRGTSTVVHTASTIPRRMPTPSAKPSATSVTSVSIPAPIVQPLSTHALPRATSTAPSSTVTAVAAVRPPLFTSASSPPPVNISFVINCGGQPGSDSEEDQDGDEHIEEHVKAISSTVRMTDMFPHARIDSVSRNSAEIEALKLRIARSELQRRSRELSLNVAAFPTTASASVDVADGTFINSTSCPAFTEPSVDIADIENSFDVPIVITDIVNISTRSGTPTVNDISNVSIVNTYARTISPPAATTNDLNGALIADVFTDTVEASIGLTIKDPSCAAFLDESTMNSSSASTDTTRSITPRITDFTSSLFDSMLTPTCIGTTSSGRVSPAGTFITDMDVIAESVDCVDCNNATFVTNYVPDINAAVSVLSETGLPEVASSESTIVAGLSTNSLTSPHTLQLPPVVLEVPMETIVQPPTIVPEATSNFANTDLALLRQRIKLRAPKSTLNPNVPMVATTIISTESTVTAALENRVLSVPVPVTTLSTETSSARAHEFRESLLRHRQMQQRLEHADDGLGRLRAHIDALHQQLSISLQHAARLDSYRLDLSAQLHVLTHTRQTYRQGESENMRRLRSVSQPSESLALTNHTSVGSHIHTDGGIHHEDIEAVVPVDLITNVDISSTRVIEEITNIAVDDVIVLPYSGEDDSVIRKDTNASANVLIGGLCESTAHAAQTEESRRRIHRQHVRTLQEKIIRLRERKPVQSSTSIASTSAAVITPPVIAKPSLITPVGMIRVTRNKLVRATALAATPRLGPSKPTHAVANTQARSITNKNLHPNVPNLAARSASRVGSSSPFPVRTIVQASSSVRKSAITTPSMRTRTTALRTRIRQRQMTLAVRALAIQQAVSADFVELRSVNRLSPQNDFWRAVLQYTATASQAADVSVDATDTAIPVLPISLAVDSVLGKQYSARSASTTALLALVNEATEMLLGPMSTEGIWYDGPTQATYESPLLLLHAYRMSSYFRTAPPSLTVIFPSPSIPNTRDPRRVSFSNNIDPHRVFCAYEINGVCNATECSFQHRRDYELSAAELASDFASYSDINNTSALTTTADVADGVSIVTMALGASRRRWMHARSNPKRKFSATESTCNGMIGRPAKRSSKGGGDTAQHVAKRARTAINSAIKPSATSTTTTCSNTQEVFTMQADFVDLLQPAGDTTDVNSPTLGLIGVRQTLGGSDEGGSSALIYRSMLSTSSDLSEQDVSVCSAVESDVIMRPILSEQQFEAERRDAGSDPRFWLQFATKNPHTEPAELNWRISVLVRGLEVLPNTEELWLAYLDMFRQKVCLTDYTQVLMRTLQLRPTSLALWQRLIVSYEPLEIRLQLFGDAIASFYRALIAATLTTTAVSPVSSAATSILRESLLWLVWQRVRLLTEAGRLVEAVNWMTVRVLGSGALVEASASESALPIDMVGGVISPADSLVNLLEPSQLLSVVVSLLYLSLNRTLPVNPQQWTDSGVCVVISLTHLKKGTSNSWTHVRHLYRGLHTQLQQCCLASITSSIDTESGGGGIGLVWLTVAVNWLRLELWLEGDSVFQSDARRALQAACDFLLPRSSCLGLWVPEQLVNLVHISQPTAISTDMIDTYVIDPIYDFHLAMLIAHPVSSLCWWLLLVHTHRLSSSAGGFRSAAVRRLVALMADALTGSLTPSALDAQLTLLRCHTAVETLDPMYMDTCMQENLVRLADHFSTLHSASITSVYGSQKTRKMRACDSGSSSLLIFCCMMISIDIKNDANSAVVPMPLQKIGAVLQSCAAFTHADPLLSCQLLHAALSVINTLVRLLGRGETVPVRIALSDWLNRWLTRLVRDRISVGLSASDDNMALAAALLRMLTPLLPAHQRVLVQRAVLHKIPSSVEVAQSLMALELFGDSHQGARATLEFSARNTVVSTPLPATHYLALAAFEQNRTEAVRRVLMQGIAALPYANHLYEQLLRIERECGNTAAVDQLLATQRRLGLPVAS